MEFETAKGYLDRLGIDYGQDTEYRGEPGKGRKAHGLPVFRTVGAGLRAQDWMAIASRDGEDYIGGCCGQTSAIQDVICGWFRSSTYYVPLGELAEVAEAMIRHDGDDHSHFSLEPWDWFEGEDFTDWESAISWLEMPHPDPEAAGFWPGDEAKRWQALKPWYKLALVWQLVKDHWAPAAPGAIRRDYSPADEAISIVDSIAMAISMHRTFSGLREGDVTPRDKMRRAGHLHRFIPALKTVLGHIQELDLGTFEGWALVDLRKPDLDDEEETTGICQNGYGYCVYDSREAMNEILSLWQKNDAAREERKDEDRIENRIGIRPIRVSLDLENGFEFTGPLERL